MIQNRLPVVLVTVRIRVYIYNKFYKPTGLIQGVPELADQTYSAFSLVITESNSVKKKGQGIIDFL
jgi:hypothetical protein